MKQLSGKSKPKWLVLAGQMLAGTVFVAMTISVLPVLLMMSLVTALLLILTWTPETEPALMRASLPARIGQEKLHESQTPQPRADHSQVADR